MLVKFFKDLWHDESGGFLSILGKIGRAAVGFIPGVGPIASAALNFGAGVAGNLLSNRGKGGGRGGGNNANSSNSASNDPVIKDLLAGQNQIRDVTIGQATKSLKRSRDAADPVQTMLSRLLGGDKAETARAIGPQANTVLAQFESARQAATQNAPRGGARNVQLASVPFQKAGAVSDLVQKTIPTAVEGLTRLSGQEAQTGASLAQTAAAAGGSGLSALISGRTADKGLELSERERKDRNKAALATGIGKTFSDIFGLILKKKKGSDAPAGGT